MATKMLQLNLDENLENASLKLFSSLGLDMTGAVTLFLKQCIICEGLPFNSEITKYKPEVIDAMLDAKRVSQDPNVKAYDSFSEAILDMETEDDEDDEDDDDEEDEESTNSNVKSSYKNNVEKMTLFNEI